MRLSLNWVHWGMVGLAGISLILGACGAATSEKTTPTPLSPTVDTLSTVIALQAALTDTPTITPSPSPTATPTLTPTPTLTLTPSPTPTSSVTSLPTAVPASATPYPTNTPRSTQVALNPILPTVIAEYTGDVPPQDHYVLARPFPRDPTNVVRDFLSRSYPYGSTAGGQFQTHHGVDIQNNFGTDILAAASGWVLYAGDDLTTVFGPRPDFYGYLVVLEHEVRAPNGQMLYTLYGHMSQVDVQTGQRVEQGQKIGEVGATGVALGAHLHLEVRLGNAYDYNSTYNPDLWLQPWPGFGTLAGRVTDRDGKRVYDVTINVRSDDGGPDRYTFSYADDEVNPDPFYGEHYTLGDLPAGDYRVFVRMSGVLRYQGTVNILPGQTNWLDIVLN